MSVRSRCAGGGRFSTIEGFVDFVAFHRTVIRIVSPSWIPQGGIDDTGSVADGLLHALTEYRD